MEALLPLFPFLLLIAIAIGWPLLVEPDSTSSAQGLGHSAVAIAIRAVGSRMIIEIFQK